MIFILTFRGKELVLTCIEIEPGRMQAITHVGGSHPCYYLWNLEISHHRAEQSPKRLGRGDIVLSPESTFT